MSQRRGTGISAKVQILVEREIEGLAHFGVGPVRQAQGLESTCQALRQTLGKQERGRSEQNHLEWPLLARVLIPEPLHRLRPRRNLLDLVQHEHRAYFVGGLQPRGLPLLADPVGAA